MRVYVLNIFGILAGRCGSEVVRERYWGPSTTLGCDCFFFFLIETLSLAVTVYEREIPGGPFSAAVQIYYLPKLNVEVREIRGL